MSRRKMRAVAEKWFGSTDQFIETEDLLSLLSGVATYGMDDAQASAAVNEKEHGHCVDLVLEKAAATRLLSLLDDPVELRRVSDAVIVEEELTEIDAESLGALLNNLHIDRAEYRKAYEMDGDVLRFRID